MIRKAAHPQKRTVYAHVLWLLYRFLPSRYHSVAQRFLSFVVMGGFTTLLQAVLFIFFKQYGYSTFVAGMLAVEISIIANFAANALVTFRSRFQGMSRLQLFKYVPLLLVVFNALNPALYLIAGPLVILEGYGVPTIIAWLGLETITLVAGFLLADQCSFGSTLRILQRANRVSAAS